MGGSLRAQALRQVADGAGFVSAMSRTKLHPVHSRLSAIMIADIVGFSRLIDKNESGNIDRVSRSIKLFRDLIGDYGGKVINIAGDGIFALFDSAARAIRFAAEFQRELKNEVVWNEGDERIAFRIGISLGETTPTADGVYGHSVNVAARVQALAEPGGICITDLAKRAVHDWSSLKLRPLGRKSLKNIDEPVEIFAVEIEEGSERANVVTLREPIWERSEKIENASVAILPLVNLTGELTDRHLCEGITTDIISGLSRFRDIIVIARNSVEPFRNRDVAADEIGRRIGQLLARRGRNEQAKVAFLQAIQLDPNSAAAHRELAQMLMKLDDLPDALQHLERAARLAPTDRATFSALAQAYARTGDRERAATFANRSRRLPDIARARDPVRDPMQSLGCSAGIYAQRGRKSLLVNRFDEAIQAFRLAQEVRPDDPDIRRLLGTALGRVGRFDEALAEFDNAARLGPPGADDYLNWGNIFLGIGDREQAISHFREALRIDPSYINAHFNLGLTLERNGRRSEAIEHYQRVVAVDPEHSAARRLAKLVDANP